MTAHATSLIGIDWGTSNRRAYVISQAGALLRKHEDEYGILHVHGSFEDSLATLLEALEVGPADVVMSGMVGSRNGWKEAPYAEIDLPLTGLAAAMMDIGTSIPGTRVRVVPGYRYTDPTGLPDVMRGEEVQVLGARQLSGSDGWFLLPGTHSKWVRVEGDRIAEFMTFMTGELYALLSQHGTLSKIVASEESVPEAFADGLRAARHGTFTHTAFCCRARVVTDMMPASHSASYLSGLLIGTELFDIVRKAGGTMSAPVQVVGSPALSARYLSALELIGIPARAWQPDSVYVTALHSLFQLPG